MYERLRVDRSTTVDRVVDALRAALFAGDLEPGTPLREQPLAEALGVARSTVREAMTETHLAIHRSLVALTGSERLIATADAVTGEARLALARVDALRQDARQQVASHRKLVRLLERGELDECVEELRRHLAGAQESLLEAIAIPNT